jgi:hypothetical protein
MAPVDFSIVTFSIVPCAVVPASGERLGLNRPKEMGS